MREQGTDEQCTELRCGVLIDGTGTPAQEDMSVLLQGRRVAAISPWADRDHDRGHRVLDCRESTVMPGLVDGHAHLCAGAPQSAAWDALPDDTSSLVAWGLASCSAALAAGITTVVDCGSRAGSALLVRDLVQSGVAAGPKILAAGEAITTTAGHGEDLGTTADDAAEVRSAVRGLVKREADLIKVMVTGGATDPHTNRRQAQYSTEELRVAIEDAHRLGRLVVGHANATEGIVRAVRAGIDVVAHCNWLGADPGTVVLDLPTVEAMARQGTFVDLNVQGGRRPLTETDGRPVAWPDALPYPSSRWELLAPLRQAGVRIYVSSDAFGPAIGSFPSELVSAASQWGVAVEDLVHRVTGLPALAFGLDEVGVIERGRDADLIVLRGDLRADPSTLARPMAVFQRGERAVDSGRLFPPAVARAHQDEAHAQAMLLAEVLGELG